jgi:hypothetical protein
MGWVTPTILEVGVLRNMHSGGVRGPLNGGCEVTSCGVGLSVG